MTFEVLRTEKHEEWALRQMRKRSKCVPSKEAKLFFFLLHFSCKGCKSVQGETTVEGSAALTSGAGRKLSKTRFIVVCKKQCLHGPAHMFALRWLSGPLKRKRCIALAAVLLTGQRYSVLSVVLNGFSSRVLRQRSKNHSKDNCFKEEAGAKWLNCCQS